MFRPEKRTTTSIVFFCDGSRTTSSRGCGPEAATAAAFSFSSFLITAHCCDMRMRMRTKKLMSSREIHLGVVLSHHLRSYFLFCPESVCGLHIGWLSEVICRRLEVLFQFLKWKIPSYLTSHLLRPRTPYPS